jgi:23S rRNA (adenine2030-N6)-methyltransferase
MFSYRHAFHAGNHADVLKHLVLIHCVHYLQEKEGALMLIDTHAGAGLYSLREGYATISQESQTGIDRLCLAKKEGGDRPELKSYWDALAAVNPQQDMHYYPGSPLILAKQLRPQDRLRLFELHPSDISILQTNISPLKRDQQIEIRKEDGFTHLKSLLPPSGRRGFVLIDPSYELKSDYRKLETCLSEALERFVTGTYVIWYPVLPRRESMQLPKRLQSICEKYQRPWLQAELRISNQIGEKRLQASGVWVINPVWTLSSYLEKVLPLLQKALGEDQHSAYRLVISKPT